MPAKLTKLQIKRKAEALRRKLDRAAEKLVTAAQHDADVEQARLDTLQAAHEAAELEEALQRADDLMQEEAHKANVAYVKERYSEPWAPSADDLANVPEHDSRPWAPVKNPETMPWGSPSEDDVEAREQASKDLARRFAQSERQRANQPPLWVYALTLVAAAAIIWALAR